MTSKNLTNNSFILDDSVLTEKKIKLALSENYKYITDKSSKTKQHYFDTFDWLIYNKNKLLIRDGNLYKITDINENTIDSTLTINSRKQPVFWQDFPDSELKNQLKSLIDIRALIPKISLEKNIQTLRVVNEDEKTIVRVKFEKIYLLKENAKKAHLFDSINLVPVRGYNKELQNVKKFLRKIGLKTTKTNTFSLSLENINLEPGAYSSKLNVKLNPLLNSEVAAVLIYKDLVSTMKQNEQGIKDDIDIEFLHDFRVAVRRTRSALSQIKEVFSPEDTNHFKAEFSKLGKTTNKLRDLDVYLESKEYYKSMLSPDLHEGLELIFKILKTERNREQKKVTKYLNSRVYEKVINSWENFLNSEKQAGANSEIPISDLAKLFILKKYNRIIKSGLKINDSTPDQKLHDLRIECKKLRYLLEFFTSLFPEEEISFIIKQFKKLQDNLGDFNDLYVQQESLKSMLTEYKIKAEDLPKVSMSIGGLISVLDLRQKEVRKEFSDSFKIISNKDYRNLFNKLFLTTGN